jgi:hypothetical protein
MDRPRPLDVTNPRDLASVASHAGRRCSEAADAAARCAAACLSDARAPELLSCAEWCIRSARVLGAAADLLRSGPDGTWDVLLRSVTDAALIAAEECADACGDHASSLESCATAADACETAARALQLVAADVGGLADAGVVRVGAA